jgi:hypothetical protein
VCTAPRHGPRNILRVALKTFGGREPEELNIFEAEELSVDRETRGSTYRRMARSPSWMRRFTSEFGPAHSASLPPWVAVRLRLAAEATLPNQ